MRTRLYLFLAVVLVLFVLSAQACFAEDPKAPPACANPDVDKPHAPDPCTEDCWYGSSAPCTTLTGHKVTCTQAASANVIYAECCLCCDFTPDQIYQGIVANTGDVAQWPEEEKQSMLDWVESNCPDCTLEISIAHRGYTGQDPVDSQNVHFSWADQEIARGEHIKIWVRTLTKFPPPPPSGKWAGSHELTYKGRTGNQAHIHDSDCDIDGTDDDFYAIGSDANGEYLENYFGAGDHGYLHGVISVSGQRWCSNPIPSLTHLGMIILVALVIGSTVFIMLRRRKTAVPV